MGRFLVRRLGLSFFSLFFLITATFFLLRLLPGGPFDDEPSLAPQVIESLKRQYALDQPLVSQYRIFMGNVVRLNFGNSILYSGRPVTEAISSAFPRTFNLGMATLLISLILGMALGFLFFLSGSQWLVRIIHFIFLSAPTLFLGPMVIFVFGLWWNILPITVGESWISYTLPLMVLCIRPSANLARLLIAALEESLDEPWAITATAYGFSRMTILMKYALKQSMIPMLSYLGQACAGIFSGSIVVELLFNVQGLGSQFVESLINRDYSLIVALTLLYGAILIFSNMVFDLMIYFFDPRIEQN